MKLKGTWKYRKSYKLMKHSKGNRQFPSSFINKTNNEANK